MDCIICRSNAGKLTSMGEKGLQTILAFAIKRGDNSVGNLQAGGMYAIHEVCRKSYMRSINVLSEPVATASQSEVKPSIVSDKLYSWEHDCFFVWEISEDEKQKRKYEESFSGFW